MKNNRVNMITRLQTAAHLPKHGCGRSSSCCRAFYTSGWSGCSRSAARILFLKRFRMAKIYIDARINHVRRQLGDIVSLRFTPVGTRRARRRVVSVLILQ